MIESAGSERQMPSSRLARLLVLAALGVMVLALPARAQLSAENPVVVELYTAQGCAACPPADALLDELADREGVIALALHVDYWDYIGWADPHARPEFTERQKQYARAAGARSIYTPQMIIQGLDRVPGTRAAEVIARVLDAARRPAPVLLRITRENGTIRVVLHADPPLGRAAGVHLVRYMPEASVLIAAGENAGREARGRNVVTHWEHLSDWSGEAPLALDLDLSGPDPAVLIVQEEGPGPILAAAPLP
jgi:hypothetical protein